MNLIASPEAAFEIIMASIGMDEVTEENYPKCHARAQLSSPDNSMTLEFWKVMIGAKARVIYVPDEEWMRRLYWNEVHSAYYDAGIDTESMTYDTPEEAVFCSGNEFDKIQVKPLRKWLEKARIGSGNNMKFHEYLLDDGIEERIWIIEDNGRFRPATEEDVLEFNL